MRRDVRSLGEMFLPIAAFGLLLALLAVYFQRGFIPGDSFTYLAAGERLNDGHALYALGPGDRPVSLHPPYWSVPFLSPPFMAVVWRPLAALPFEIGVYLWWAATISAILAVLVALLRRRPVIGSAAMIALLIPLTYEIGVGNVNSLLLAGAISVWLLARRGSSAPAGAVTAAMVAAKLTPLPLAAWVIGVGRRRAIEGFAVGLAFCAVVSVLGAGLAAHLEYIGVARATGTTGLTEASLGGLGRAIGLPDPIPTFLTTIVFVAGATTSCALGAAGRPAAGFAAAILGWTLGSPVVNVNTPVLLLALLAPVAWPWPQGRVAGMMADGVAIGDRRWYRRPRDVDDRGGERSRQSFDVTQ